MKWYTVSPMNLKAMLTSLWPAISLSAQRFLNLHPKEKPQNGFTGSTSWVVPPHVVLPPAVDAVNDWGHLMPRHCASRCQPRTRWMAADHAAPQVDLQVLMDFSWTASCSKKFFQIRHQIHPLDCLCGVVAEKQVRHSKPSHKSGLKFWTCQIPSCCERSVGFLTTKPWIGYLEVSVLSFGKIR